MGLTRLLLEKKNTDKKKTNRSHPCIVAGTPLTASKACAGSGTNASGLVPGIEGHDCGLTNGKVRALECWETPEGSVPAFRDDQTGRTMRRGHPELPTCSKEHPPLNQDLGCHSLTISTPTLRPLLPWYRHKNNEPGTRINKLYSGASPPQSPPPHPPRAGRAGPPIPARPGLAPPCAPRSPLPAWGAGAGPARCPPTLNPLKSQQQQQKKKNLIIINRVPPPPPAAPAVPPPPAQA